MKKSSSRKKNSGFTLIETIVTISIVSILASIAVPSFNTMIVNNRTTAATNEWISALVLARSEALKRSNNVSICSSTDQASCAGSGVKDFAQGWIVFQDCNANGKVDAKADCDNDGKVDDEETVIKAHRSIKNIEILGKKAFFSYTFSGRSGVATFNVNQANPPKKKLRKVIVSRSGRVRSCVVGKTGC